MLYVVMSVVVVVLGLVAVLLCSFLLAANAEVERLRDMIAGQHHDLRTLQQRAADTERRIWWGRD